MHFVAIVQILVLLTVANGTPVVMKKIFGSRFADPLDGGLRFVDQRPLFGRSKTIRGTVAALLVTTAAAPLLGLAPALGAVVAVTAMAGDLLSSFIKRRLGLPSSSAALGIDQVPECLLPFLACSVSLSLTVLDILLGVALFFAGELVLSRLLYRIGLRDEPY